MALSEASESGLRDGIAGGFWIFAAVTALPLSRTGSQSQRQQIFFRKPFNPKSPRSQLVQTIERIGPIFPLLSDMAFAHTCLLIQYLSASNDPTNGLPRVPASI